MPIVEFEPATEANTKKMNVGIILSGGQAPGGHNVITGLFDQIKKLNPENRLFGFILGPGGLVDHNYMELTKEIIDEYRNTGGFDMIGSGRTKLEKVDQFEKGLEIIRELDIKAIVIIGGDDSNTNACVLAEYYAAKQYGVQVIGCPKTIDGDLKNEQIETSYLIKWGALNSFYRHPQVVVCLILPVDVKQHQLLETIRFHVRVIDHIETQVKKILVLTGIAFQQRADIQTELIKDGLVDIAVGVDQVAEELILLDGLQMNLCHFDTSSTG